MKLYDFGPAANAFRVRMFLAEKGVQIPLVELNVREGAQRVEPFTSMNPWHCVPFLELDDGQVIAESLAICRYVEELHPTPALFGETPAERGEVEMWTRRLELDCFLPGLHAVRNTLPPFAGRVIPGHPSELPQMPEMKTRGVEMMEVFFDRLEPLMAGKDFIAAGRMTIADIIGLQVTRMASALGIEMEARYPEIHRWGVAIAARPSTEA